MFYPVQLFSDWLVFGLFGMTEASHLGLALNFFIYDTIKILILLLVITHIMGAINALFPIEKVKDFLSQNKFFGLEYVVASLFGTVTPFCSCSSVPLFIGFVKGGIPLGITFAFLISSPLVDGVVIALLLGLFGVKVTVVYVLTGIVVSVIAGYILGKLNLERFLADWVTELHTNGAQPAGGVTGEKKKSFMKKVSQEAFAIFKHIYLYVIAGVAVGAFIHGYVPADFFETYVATDNIWSVPLAVLVGVPLYAGAAGVLPIAHALVAKGISLGTVLAFMMASVALSLPEGLMLKKIMKWQLLAIFFGIVTVAIIASGYFFNLVL